MNKITVISRAEAENLLAEEAKLTSLQIEQFLGRRESISKETIDEAINVAQKAGVKIQVKRRANHKRRFRGRRRPLRADEKRLTFKVASKEAGRFAELEVQ